MLVCNIYTYNICEYNISYITNSNDILVKYVSICNKYSKLC